MGANKGKRCGRDQSTLVSVLVIRSLGGLFTNWYFFRVSVEIGMSQRG